MERYLRAKLKTGGFADVSPLRSSIMAAIKSKSNRTTEGSLRLALVRAGVSGWRLHAREIPGRPDFYFEDFKIAIFVDGCFWHGCPRCGHVPKTRSVFWRAKFERNRIRDRRYGRELALRGIRVVRFWEHSLRNKKQLERAVTRVKSLIEHP